MSTIHQEYPDHLFLESIEGKEKGRFSSRYTEDPKPVQDAQKPVQDTVAKIDWTKKQYTQEDWDNLTNQK